MRDLCDSTPAEQPEHALRLTYLTYRDHARTITGPTFEGKSARVSKTVSFVQCNVLFPRFTALLNDEEGKAGIVSLKVSNGSINRGFGG